MVRNLRNDHLRRRNELSHEPVHRIFTEPGNGLLVSTSPGMTTDGPDFTTLLALRNDLSEAFSTLCGRLQVYLVLATIDGLPLIEVAERMQLTRSAASALGFRARRALQEAYLAREDLVRAPGR